MKERIFARNFRFQPQQIVYLTHDNCCLYAEVIQEVPERQICWVRPVLLVDAHFLPEAIYDLRSAPDLVWPLQGFSPALDTDVIPLLAELEPQELESSETLKTARSRLNQFIKQVWQEERDTKKRKQ